MRDELELGHGVSLCWDEDGQGFIWKHPTCRGYASLRFVPDPKSTGHKLIAGGMDDGAHLTIEGSLLCPMGCGEHGFIQRGRWVPA